MTLKYLWYRLLEPTILNPLNRKFVRLPKYGRYGEQRCMVCKDKTASYWYAPMENGVFAPWKVDISKDGQYLICFDCALENYK